MNQQMTTVLLGAIAAAACPALADSTAPVLPSTRCEANGDTIEYRAYLPDQRRFVFVSVKVLHGTQPSVFIIIDKNFDSAGVDVTQKSDPLVAWWLDRSRPLTFSGDKIKVTWKSGGVWNTIWGWIGSNGEDSVTQPIRGLVSQGGNFLGKGTSDTNSYAYQSRIELPGFSGDELAVSVPAVTFDGVTVTPPVVHFTDTDETPTTKC